MGKLETNKQQKKDKLYNTAFELFITKGISKTTISDIVSKAGIAKGTFYLYFKDKYDIRNKLVVKKASELFLESHNALLQTDITDFEEQLMFIIDYIIAALQKNTSLLNFIAKNLSWGVFRSAFNQSPKDSDENFFDMFYALVPSDVISRHDAEILLFQLTEFIGSTAYSTILYSEPLSMDEFMPHLHNSVHALIHQYYNR